MMHRLVTSYMRLKSNNFLRLKKNFDHSKIKPTKNKTTLYVHIPFCKKLCPYCSFTRYEYDDKDAKRYYVALKKEIDIYKKKGFKFSNVYFGGGTPTIDIGLLISLIDHVKQIFDVKEVSVETTIKGVTDENIIKMKDAGVTRLSIGMQSFEKKVLKAIGREHHMISDVLERIKKANAAFDTLNIDLIFNFPSQTLKSFDKDIKMIKKLKVSQVTFYPLMPNVSTKTAIERRFNSIDTKKEKAFFSLIKKNFDGTDYNASSVWCYSLGKKPIDEYFIDHKDYVGVGAGAMSFTGETFRTNTFSLDKYEKSLKKDKIPIIFWKNLSIGEHMQYYLLTKLFSGSVDKRGFLRVFNRNIGSAMMFELNGMKILGWIKEDKDKLIVTDKGRFYVSVLEKEFFSGLNKLREYCTKERL